MLVGMVQIFIFNGSKWTTQVIEDNGDGGWWILFLLEILHTVKTIPRKRV